MEHIEKIFENELQLNIGSVVMVFVLAVVFLSTLMIRRDPVRFNNRIERIKKAPTKSVLVSILIILFSLLFLWLVEQFTFRLGFNVGTLLFVFLIFLVFFLICNSQAFRTLPEIYALRRFFRKVWAKKEGRWIIFSFFSITLLFACLQWLGLPESGESFKINPIPGVGFEISDERAGRNESLYVISVPAYRMFTLTGITLHPRDRITQCRGSRAVCGRATGSDSPLIEF